MHREKSGESISVACEPGGAGWSCRVTIGNAEDSTDHQVDVTADELDRLAPGASDPTRLVQASVAYLLEHEPKESILPRFGLKTIASYFPSYPTDIRSRL
jgi:hypothetical protein